MRTLFEIIEPILLIFGSIAAAITLCWLLWRWTWESFTARHTRFH